MATKLITENEAYTIGGSGSPTTNRLCTLAKAVDSFACVPIYDYDYRLVASGGTINNPNMSGESNRIAGEGWLVAKNYWRTSSNTSCRGCYVYKQNPNGKWEIFSKAPGSTPYWLVGKSGGANYVIYRYAQDQWSGKDVAYMGGWDAIPACQTNYP